MSLNYGEVLELLEAFSHDAENDGGAGNAPHLLHGIADRHVLGAGPVDLDDMIPGLDACPPGRRVLDGRNDGEDRVALDADGDAEAPELTFGVDLHLLEHIFGHEGGVGIQFLEEAPDRPVDELLGIDGVDVIGFHQGKHLCENLQVLVGFRSGGRPEAAPADNESDNEDQGQKSPQSYFPVLQISHLLSVTPPSKLSRNSMIASSRLLDTGGPVLPAATLSEGSTLCFSSILSASFESKLPASTSFMTWRCCAFIISISSPW